MKQGNEVSMNIKEGTLFLNDDVTIEFKEAVVTILSKAGNELTVQNTEKVLLPVKPEVKIKKEKKPKVEKVKVIVKKKGKVALLNGREPLIDYSLITECLMKNGPLKINLLLIKLGSVKVNAKQLGQICWFMKLKGILMNYGVGIYGVPTPGSSNNKPEQELKVNVNVKKTAPVKKESLGETLVPEVHYHIPKTDEEELASSTATGYIYPSGKALLVGDTVRALDINARTEDDILLFPEEVIGLEGIVQPMTEGSDCIKVMFDDNVELLLYAHWMELVQRN